MSGLGTAGKAFLAEMLAAYAYATKEGALVLEAARAADAVEAWRVRAAEDGRQQATASRLHLGWSRHFAALVAQLRMTP